LIVTALASQLIKSGYREDWPRLATQLEALYRVGELHGLAAAKAWQIEVDRADRALIEQAAAQLRHGAIRAGYAGLPGKHVAFALALVLDEIARHYRDLDDQLRARILDGCRGVLGQQVSS
jgi:hypothetical protein